MQRSYDAIANIYDGLARLFIGKALRDAQLYLLQYIPKGAKILIAGGGTGWILEAIAHVHSAGLHIDYLDSSAKMIAKANMRNVQQNTVRFLHQSANEDFNGSHYDVILTPFFFNNFSDTTMRRIFCKLHQKLKPNGLWLYADFQVAGDHQFLQRLMLNVMYTFFRVACNIEASQLPDVAARFAQHQYQLIDKRTFKQQFMISVVYKNVL